MTHRCKYSRRSVLARFAGLAALTVIGLPWSAVAQSPGSPIKIGIVGAGRMGGTLAALWVKAGHPVLISAKDSTEAEQLARSLGPLAQAGTVHDAIAFGDAVLIAVPYAAYPQIGKDNAQDLSGKVVLDLGNAVPARDGEIANEAREAGIGITSAKYLAGARVVRAFNTLGYRIIADNAGRPQRLAIPVAGDDQAAIAVVSKLVTDAGFDPVLIGPLARASLFAQGAPLYGQQISAEEMRARAKSLQP